MKTVLKIVQRTNEGVAKIMILLTKTRYLSILIVKMTIKVTFCFTLLYKRYITLEEFLLSDKFTEANLLFNSHQSSSESFEMI